MQDTVALIRANETRGYPFGGNVYPEEDGGTARPRIYRGGAVKKTLGAEATSYCGYQGCTRRGVAWHGGRCRNHAGKRYPALGSEQPEADDGTEEAQTRAELMEELVEEIFEEFRAEGVIGRDTPTSHS